MTSQYSRNPSVLSVWRQMYREYCDVIESSCKICSEKGIFKKSVLTFVRLDIDETEKFDDLHNLESYYKAEMKSKNFSASYNACMFYRQVLVSASKLNRVSEDKKNLTA